MLENSTTAPIRPARHEDLAALIELARRSWLSAFAQTAPLELIDWWAASGRTRRLYEAEWSEMFVHLEGATIVGIVHPKLDEINGLWVHPSAQSRGIGTRLLRFGESKVRESGASTAWLTCAAMNPRGLAFYRRSGYRETARTTVAHPSGVRIEEVRMERPLP